MPIAVSKKSFPHLVVILIIGIISISGCQQKKNTSKVPPSETIPTPPPPETNFDEHPKNIILMIGDGMGVSQLSAGFIAKRDAVALAQFSIIGLVEVYAGDNLITDSAAGATAFATGEKTYREAVGVNIDTMPLPTILEIAEQHQLATGLVATSSVTHATPASFIAHQPDRHMPEAIAHDYLETPVDIVMGGGKQYFKERKDGKNLLDSLRANKYSVTHNLDNAQHKTAPLACFIADKHPPRVDEGREGYLPRATQMTLEKLSKNEKGFFVMIEGSQIDWGGHENDTEYITEEMKDFDDAVQQALAFARQDSNTLLIVTSDHECGGFAINGGSFNNNEVEGAFTTDYHTASMVPLFAFGPGAEQFQGVQDNTHIFHKMKAALQLAHHN
jgi:alkaline phosphatase